MCVPHPSLLQFESLSLPLQFLSSINNHSARTHTLRIFPHSSRCSFFRSIDRRLHPDSSSFPCSATPTAMANGAETPWLKAMLEATYSDECPQHSKSWTNHFCLDCEESDPFCSECLGPHTGHRYITVVKSNHRVAVSVRAIGEHLNVSLVKTYTTNGEKVVCLNKRPPTDPKSGKKLPECSCKSSTLVLRSSFEFCSIACKLNGIERGCEGLTFLPARKRNVSKVNSGSAVQSKPRKGKGKRKVVNVPKRNVVNSGSAVQSTPRKGKGKVVNVPNESRSGSRGPPPENPPEPNPMLRRSRRKGVACRGPLS